MMFVDGLIVAMIAAGEQDREGSSPGVGLVYDRPGVAGWLPIARYDLVPSALAFAAASRWKRGQTILAGILAGVGGLVKLFPVVVLWPGLVQPGRRRTRGFVAMLLTIVVGVVVWFAIGGSGMFAVARLSFRPGVGDRLGVRQPLDCRRQGCRLADVSRFQPLVVEGDHARWRGLSPRRRSPFRSQSGAWCWVVSCLSHRADSVRYAGASVLAFALFGKVLSPQYLLWILPFVAIETVDADGSLDRSWSFAGGSAPLVYFWAGVGLLGFQPIAVAILVVRNAGWVLLGILIADQLERPAKRP